MNHFPLSVACLEYPIRLDAAILNHNHDFRLEIMNIDFKNTTADEPHFIEPENSWLFRYQSPLIASNASSPLPSPTASPTSQGNRGKISSGATTPTSPSSRGISQSPGSYFCQLCGKKFNSDKTFSAHLSSASHQSRVKQTSRASSQSKSVSSSSASTRSKPQTTQKSPSKLSRPSSSSFEYDEDDSSDGDEDDVSSSAGPDPTDEESDDSSSSDDSELTEDEEELASALLMVQSAAKLQQGPAAQKATVVSSTDLDKAYKLFLQAAKIYNKHWRVRDSSKAFCAVLDIQRQLLSAKRTQSATPVTVGRGPASPSRVRSSQQLSSAPICLLDISRSSTETGKIDPTLLPHVMVLLKVTLYVGRLLRGFQPLQALDYFQSTLDHIVSSTSIAAVGVDCAQTPSPSSLTEGTNTVLSLLEPIISFVDSQRAASPQQAVPFGKELQSIIAECVTYIAALDATPRGLSRSLFFLALSNALGTKYGYSSTSQSRGWYLRMQAQLYTNTPALWWSSDCWIQLSAVASVPAAASVLFKEFAVTAALLCNDLVRVKRALARCSSEAEEEPLLALLCRFGNNKLDGNPLFFEQSRLEWPVTRAELLRELSTRTTATTGLVEGGGSRSFLAAAREGIILLLEDYLNTNCKAA